MKKVVIACSGIALITLLVMPKFVANSVDKKLLSITHTINQNPAYKASFKEHYKSWFSSAAIIEVGLNPQMMGTASAPDAKKELADMKLEVEFNAHYGPVLTHDGLSLGLVSWAANVSGESLRDTIEFDNTSPIYQITSHTNLLGHSTFSDEIPSFTAKENAAFTQASFSGWKGNGTVSRDHTTYQGKMDTFNAKSALGDMKINGWRFDLDMQTNILDALEGSFYDSTSFMEIQDMVFESAMTDESIALENLKMDGVSEFDKENDLLDTKINMTLSNFKNASFNLTEVAIHSEINNLQEKFFKAYQHFANKLTAEPEKVQENLNTFIKGSGLQQLKANPELNFSSISGKLNKGMFSGSINSKIHNVSELPDNPAEPSFWLTHIAANAQLTVDKSVALFIANNSVKEQLAANPNTAKMSEAEITNIAKQQAPVILQSILQQGMLTETGNEYKLQASLKDGKALLNGKPMPLPTDQ